MTIGYGIGEKDSYCDENTPQDQYHYMENIKLKSKVLLGRENSISLITTVFGMSPRMRLDLLKRFC